MKKYKNLEQVDSNKPMSRRKFIASTGIVAASGILTSSALASVATKKEAAPTTAPALPWSWVQLDPQEAGERAFRNYHEKGG
ncbi:MAG: hypothetical protein JRE56_07340 [Deltaproteobacteria bacterium]|jgi:predicted small secreted protein|nr:hypothetical protein [Deltaproteobacteria bacterium]